jgi:hypothetical protein
VDLSSRIDEASGVIETSLIPTPWANRSCPPDDMSITTNSKNTDPEDVFRKVFILNLLIPIAMKILNILFIK